MFFILFNEDGPEISMKITSFCLKSSNGVNTKYSEKDDGDKEDYQANRDDDDPVLPGEWLVKHRGQNCNVKSF